MVKQLEPPQAHEALKADPAAVYLDVRSEGEFAAGHAAGAVNVPVAQMRGGQMALNEEFVEVVERLFPKDQRLVVGCQSGGRSQRACEMLEAAGYRELTNVRGGFGGARDQSGAVVVAGWRDAGLPVSDETQETGYAAMRRKAGL